MHSRSNQAKQVLENKIFIEAIESLKKLYSEALLEKTGAKESDTREKLWIAYNVVGKVEQHLQTVIETGKLAQKQLMFTVGQVRQWRLGPNSAWYGIRY